MTQTLSVGDFALIGRSEKDAPHVAVNTAGVLNSKYRNRAILKFTETLQILL